MMLAAFILMGLAAGLLVATVRLDRRRAARQPSPRGPVPSGAVRPRPVRTAVPHLLYCYRRPDGRRIYGGISNSPEVRHSRHLIDLDDRWWMAQSDGVMYPLRWYPDRVTARAAERAMVRAMHFAGEDPANYQHNPGRSRVTR